MSSADSADPGPDRRSSHSYFSTRRVTLFAAVALVAAAAGALIIRELPVTIEVDLYPPADTPPVLELLPSHGAGDVVIWQPIEHEALPGGHLNVALTALAHEQETLLLTVLFSREDTEENNTQWSRFHPGNGEMRTVLLEAVLPDDILPGSMQVLVTLREAAGAPALIGHVSATLENPSELTVSNGPNGGEAGRLEPHESIELLSPDWQVPAEYVRTWTGFGDPKQRGAPILAWNNTERTLTRVESESVPRFHAFEITPQAAEAIPESETRPTYAFVHIEADKLRRNPHALVEQTLPARWTLTSVDDKQALVNLEERVTLRWARWAPNGVRVQFMRSVHGGLVQFQNKDGEHLLDLHTDGPAEWVFVDVPPSAELQRYRTVVPRKALGKSSISVPNAPWFPVQRLVVGGFIQSRFYGGAATEWDSSARIQEHWTPDLHNGAAALPVEIPWYAESLPVAGGLFVAVFGLLMTPGAVRTGLHASEDLRDKTRRRPAQLLHEASRRIQTGARQTVLAMPKIRERLRSAIRTLRPLPMWTAGILLPGALAISFLLTRFIANYPIAIGLDLSTIPESAPELVRPYAVGQASLGPMERIPPQYAPANPIIEVSSTGKAHPEAEGKAIYFTMLPLLQGLRELAEEDPPGGWLLTRGRAFTFGHAIATLRLDLFLAESPRLVFRTGPDSGIVRVATEDGEQAVDLYAEEIGEREIEITSGKWVRFYAEVARKELNGLAIDFGEEIDSIERLTLGTWRPQAFFTSRVYPAESSVRKHEEWTPEFDGSMLRVPRVSTFDTGGWLSWLVITLLAFGVLWTGAAIALNAGILLRKHFRMPDVYGGDLAPPAHPKLPLAVFAAFMAMGLFYWASFYPAALSVEGLTMWDEAHTLNLDDTNPVGYTLVMHLLSRIWDNPAIIVLLQITGLAALLAFGVSLLDRARVPRGLIVAMAALTVLSPRNNAMPLWLYRDVPYAILLVLYTLLLAAAVLHRGWRERYLFWILVGAVVGALPLVRHEGKLHVVLFLPLLLFFFWRQWRQLLTGAAIALTLFFGAKQVLYPALGVKDTTMLSAPPFWEVQSYRSWTELAVREDFPLRADEYELLYGLGISAPNFNGAYAAAPFQLIELQMRRETALPDVRKVAADVNDRYAIPILLDMKTSRLRAVYYLFFPRKEVRQGLIRPIINTSHPAVAPLEYEELYGLRQQPLLPGGHIGLTEVIRFSSAHLQWLFGQPMINLYLVLAAVIICLWRRLPYHYLVVFLPVLANTAGVAMAGTSTSVRYYFALTFVSLFMFCFAWISQTPRDDTQLHSMEPDRHV